MGDEHVTCPECGEGLRKKPTRVVDTSNLDDLLALIREAGHDVRDGWFHDASDDPDFPGWWFDANDDPMGDPSGWVVVRKEAKDGA